MFQTARSSTFVVETADREKAPEELTWEAYLEEGEKILWHGRPNAQELFSPTGIRKLVWGIPFIIFGAVMINVTWPVHGNFQGMTPIWVIAGLIIAAGFYLMISGPINDRRLRAKTWYTLTNLRAVIATDWRAKKFVSFPAQDWIDLHMTGGALKSIYFARIVKEGSSRDDTSDITYIGFEMIKDGPEVMKLFNGVEAAHK